MKLGQSQLSYLSRRGLNYNKKYLMFDDIVNLIPKKELRVLELFSGIGIETNILSMSKTIREINTLELNPDCCKILEKNKIGPQQNVLNCDVFTYEDNSEYDLVICDCNSFNNKTKESLFELVNRFNSRYKIITVTSIFNLKFNKEVTLEKYFEKLKDEFLEKGLKISNIIYTNDFCIVLTDSEYNDTTKVVNIEDVYDKWSIKNYTIWKSFVPTTNKKLF